MTATAEITGWMSMVDLDLLDEVDFEIIDELNDGARTKGYLVDETGFHRNTIGNRLRALELADVIECIHRNTALYELLKDPRGDDHEH